MSALDRVLELAGQKAGTTLVEDPAGDLVLAARTAIAELRVCLAGSDDDGDDDEGGSDHSSHSTFKALKKRGMDDGKASSLCAKADKKVKAARLAEAAEIALAGLAVPEHDWVEATAGSADLRLTGPAYGDPGHRGKQRYLVDTEPHARLSAAYVALAGPGYTEAQLEQVQGKVRAAARSFGVALTVDDAAVALAEAEALVELAKKAVGDGGVVMNHGPFNGTHSHSHFQSNVHDHPHQHFGDNHHDGGPAHRPGSKPGGRAGW